jgi:hypothetical protein
VLPESCYEWAEIFVLGEMHGIKGGAVGEGLEDPCILILASFIPDPLEGFSEIMLLCDWIAFLMRR